jgi:hypothetical protein
MASALYFPEMADPYQLSTHIGALCVKHQTNVHKLAAALRVDPVELLRMINGRRGATAATA